MKKYFHISPSFNALDIIQSLNPNVFCLIDKNNGDFILGWDKQDEICLEVYHQQGLIDFENKHKDYLFGYIGYDSKNQILPHSKSKNKDIHQFPDAVFFVCRHVIIKKQNQYLYFGTDESFNDFKQLKIEHQSSTKLISSKDINLTPQTLKKDYLKNIDVLKSKIQYGDIYEANYCVQFNQTNVKVDAINTYLNLKKNTKAPFSSYFKYKHIEVLSASPERFYKKYKTTIISQPIKGTAPRVKNKLEDDKIISALKNNQKEIAENVMIVDLVRNDLSKFKNVKSVNTPELCKVYSFNTVHQLISTVEAKLTDDVMVNEVVENLFPMGSMTGAPKVSACQIIDEVENFKRGIYSGTVGYISPNKNHDFNVVIRSVLYNSNNKTVSVSVGGAITIQSNPQDEYDECLLKLKAISQSIVGMSNK